MAEKVVIRISSQNQVVQAVIKETVEHVYVLVSSAGGSGSKISKVFYKVTGSEGNSVTVLGIGSAVWSQVTLGVTPLEEVSGVPGTLQYKRTGDTVTFGDTLSAGENILFEWQ